ncbi:mechanosensitive ion channel family protein, partial [Acinetobacter baumannii]
MADEQKSLTDVAKNTGELLQEAGTKTTQTVLAHTEKYHDAYTTIDKIVDSFWERVPYICIAIIVFIIFWLLTKLFKFFVRKTLENRSYTRQNLVLVLN